MRPAHRVRRSVLAAAGSLLILAGLLPLATAPAIAASPDLFFSEYVEGSSNNKALEVFNGTGAPVNLGTGGYSVQMFFNGNPSPTLTIDLTGTVADGDVFILAHASAEAGILAVADQTNGSGWFNGDDAVALRKGTTIVDVIGQSGFDPGTEWGTGLTSTADNTLRRKTAVGQGDTNGADAFDPAVEWDGFATNTFDGLGAHSVTPPPSAPVTATCGSALTTVVGYPVTRSITATDPDGRVTSLQLVSVVPSNTGITLGATTPASSVGGTASAVLSIDAASAGTFTATVRATNDDVIPQTGSCTLSITVLAVLPIGQVQGVVGDAADGLTHRSPFAPASGNGSGATVAVRGVVAEKTIARTAAGATQHGFFLQERASATDGNPNSSDGIFVFLGSFTSLIGGYTPVVGDEILVTGRVTEFFNLTQLTSASRVDRFATGVDVATAVPPFEVAPPADLADANRYWERREGMQARVPAGSLVQGGRNVFPSTADAEIYLVRGDYAPLADRTDPYERRTFRDPHALDDVPATPFDNGNGFRFLMGPMGVKGSANDSRVLLNAARTFDELTNSPVGGVYFNFGKYQIQVATQPTFESGVDPSLNAPPQPHVPAVEWTSGTYNVENLYDFRDDPTDGCDFAGNAGCVARVPPPASGCQFTVCPPFDYVPSSLADYDAHLTALATQIVEDLHAPDIVMVQEAEDQDICRVVSGAMVCDAGDGDPDTLQELSLRIQSIGGPEYAAKTDRDGADDRGIISGFLFRLDRVELLPADADDPVLGSVPTVDYRDDPLPYNTDVQNPKALNADLPEDVDTSTGVDGSNVFTRPPSVGHFRVWRDGVGTSVWLDVWVVSNHFSSTPDGRVGQRTEQAAYLAAIVDAIEAGDPAARVVVGGDFNVFPRPDDPFSPGHPLFPSDQLAPLYDQGLTSLWDSLAEQAPEAAYSYVFNGQAQTLDSQFISDDLLAEFVEYRVAHINADWPAEFDGDGARGASDHDPSAARYDLLVSIDGLRDLVQYLDANEELRGNSARLLLDRLARADRYLKAGMQDAYRSQVQAFADQTGDLSPRFIDADVAEGLQDEAEALLAQ